MNNCALIIGYVWPEPNSSAAGSRIVQLVQALQDGGFDVHFACAAAPTDHQIDLSSLKVTPHTVALNCSSFDEFVEQLQPRVVLFDRFVTEEQFGWRVAQSCPDALRVLDTEDLHSLRYARQALLKQSLQASASVGPVLAGSDVIFSAMRDSDMILREVAAIFRCDLTLMISDYEIQLLTDYCHVPASLLYHLPFMVQSSNRLQPSFAARQNFVSIGNFRHAPNWDAVLWLKQSIWPLLRKLCPDAELHIYGAYPPKKATDLTNARERFLVKGWADNAQQVVENSRVLLAPLRFGAGIKGKLIDAMQTATPSVVTSIAAESMAGDHPWPGRLADTAEAFAQEAATLYGSESDWADAARLCRPLLQARYDFSGHTSDFLRLINERLSNLESYRRDNFLAAMFQYHSARSTEFMSRWIEVKSRLKTLQE
ncbi:glycosyltransferase [Gilvimarinus sp. 1_MG-2023]|uniref:glycosyltransferase n=1 Tax=Gilvimarinus sp. 1_MG-2023 TaxID=3062638 RepID=UPI0026E3915A|nr:glycosyltransferase [Gilvimarinus sp. 1_MG-2023]MDO6747989.1 glycosyltransferase [Gilvimarinus sp. 1_MG-2023]